MDMSQWLGIINFFLIICSSIGGYYAFRQAKRENVIRLKNETIDALNERIDTLEEKLKELQADNEAQKHIIETIKELLASRNISISIDGDIVTIKDSEGSHSVRRKPTIPLARGPERPRRPTNKRRPE
jgi:uncharacterized protein YlxW (UPF0749 family)